jgi:hypothetical protein
MGRNGSLSAASKPRCIWAHRRRELVELGDERLPGEAAAIATGVARVY